MNQIKNFFNPNRLKVTWQQPTGSGSGNSRTKYVVAEVYRDELGDNFKYALGTKDLADAMELGFTGLPSFKILEEPYSNENLLNIFLKRLPPKNRADYAEYLNTFGLPSTFDGSDFAILAYTGAKLPSDSLEIYPDLSTIVPPYEFIMEAAGTRYLNLDFSNLRIEDEIKFKLEPTNRYDPNAISLSCKNSIIGFVPRSLNKELKELIINDRVKAKIHKIANDRFRPLIFVFVEVK